MKEFEDLNFVECRPSYDETEHSCMIGSEFVDGIPDPQPHNVSVEEVEFDLNEANVDFESQIISTGPHGDPRLSYVFNNINDLRGDCTLRNDRLSCTIA